jgi:hypothetical protein
MPVEYSRDNAGKITAGNVKSDLDDDEMAKRKAAAALGSSAGTGLGAKEKPANTTQPKQDKDESIGAYSARLRAWRESEKTPAVVGQTKALKSMKPAP